MNEKLPFQQFFATMVPFIIAGIAIALFIGLLFMFSYVLIWGLIIGGILWLVTTAKNYLFPPAAVNPEARKQGRIIEHNDKK